MATKRAAIDDTVRTCLERVRARDVSAVGVLADYLEENGLPHAKRVRELWERFTRNVAYWSDPENDVSRRKWLRWGGRRPQPPMAAGAGRQALRSQLESPAAGEVQVVRGNSFQAGGA